MTTDDGAHILLASNRGPVSFKAGQEGGYAAQRGGGGLVSGLSALGHDEPVHWVCAALSPMDRKAAGRSAGRIARDDHQLADCTLRMLDIPEDTFQDAYSHIANSTLWFTHHLLHDTVNEPSFDDEFTQRWASFERYNEAFARALAEDAAPGALVLVQDYHLALVPRMLRLIRPDLRISHFSHTPWAPPDFLRMLPAPVARQLLVGILGADRAAFLTERWADAFVDCCEQLLGATIWNAGSRSRSIGHGAHRTRIGVHSLGVDAAGLEERAHRSDVEAALVQLRSVVGDRQAVVRVDRTELSKNIVRGLQAFRALLSSHPEWHERVVHLAFAYPSRTDLARYRQYTADVATLAHAINDEFGTASWQPVLLQVEDNFARSLAAYRMADVALVNPVRDGMNLVAKEIPVVSDRGCALVLSSEAGAAVELGADALLVNPFDVAETAAALDTALRLPSEERAARTKRMAASAAALPPQRWFADQVAALRG